MSQLKHDSPGSWTDRRTERL